MAELIPLFATTQIYWIVVLIAIDVVLGIIAALMKNDFRLGKLAKFMKKPVLGYVLGFVVLEMVVLAFPALTMVLQLAFVLIVLALFGSILHNLGKLGLPIPDYLKRE